MSVGAVLILVMWLLAIPYIIYMIVDVKRHWEQSKTVKVNVKYNILVSAVSNFFDTLGIGSFAIATSAWKFKKSMPDHLIPGTLNAVFVIPMCIEGTIFIQKVDVDPLTLALMIGFSMVGAIVGAKVVTRLDTEKIRIGMGIALLVVAIITLCKINGVGPFGILGTATGLTGMKLAIATLFSFLFGSFMAIGIGFYAPCMALVLMLGMNANIAFPIMMGASGYMCLANGVTFIKAGKYERVSAIPMLIVGCLAVLVAAFIVTSLPLTMLTYLVCVVMIICSGTFFRDAWRARQKHGDDSVAMTEAG